MHRHTLRAVEGKLGYRPALDGLRAVAIALVVGIHAFGWPYGGQLGVDLFFVLSGFLITTLLLEERDRTGRVALKAFYARRARRLMPWPSSPFSSSRPSSRRRRTAPAARSQQRQGWGSR